MAWPPSATPGTKLPPQGRHRAATRSPAPGGTAAVFLGLIFAASAVLLAQTANSEPANSSSQKQGSSGPVYAGSETCTACHEDISQSFAKSPHARIAGRKGWEERACEACHGPAAAHAESGAAEDVKNPLKLAVKDTDAICMDCHRNEQTAVGRLRAGHYRNEVACTACHTIHQTHEDLVARAPARQNKQCASCHSQVWAQFQRPHAHRLREGAMKCTDCHNPHGGFLSPSLRTVSANEPNCFQCHGDKRGPFTFEHAAMRMQSCAGCHEPHGSANPRMLTRHEVRFQCMECHSNIGTASGTIGGLPPAFHDTRNPRYRNCTICHVKVHGSHVNRALLR